MEYEFNENENSIIESEGDSLTLDNNNYEEYPEVPKEKDQTVKKNIRKLQI